MFLILKASGVPQPPSDPPSPVIPDTPDPPPTGHVDPEPPAPIETTRLGAADQIDEAGRFAKADQPMRLLDPERPWLSHLVARDLASPETWRHTELVDGEPFSDAEFAAAEDAFLSALRAGGLPSAA